MSLDGITLVTVLVAVLSGTRSVSVGPSRQSVALYSSPQVKGREVGRGEGPTKGRAKDGAARMALEALFLQPPPRIPMLNLRRRNSFP